MLLYSKRSISFDKTSETTIYRTKGTVRQMNMTFKAFLMKEWTVKDDRIIVGSKIIKLSSITKAEHTPISPGKSNGVVQVFYGSGAFDFATLAYPKKQKEDGEKAAQYILATVRGEDANAKVKAYEKLQKEGEFSLEYRNMPGVNYSIASLIASNCAIPLRYSKERER